MGLFSFLRRGAAGSSDQRHVRDDRRSKPRKDPHDGTRILIIDDSATIVKALAVMLQRDDKYVVIEARDAETGLELALSEMPDLIFLDLVLPGMSGFDALRKLRKHEITREIPIIIMSGNDQAIEEFYVQRIGADDFMKKPFSRAEVYVRIERLIDAHGALARASSRNAVKVDVVT